MQEIIEKQKGVTLFCSNKKPALLCGEADCKENTIVCGDLSCSCHDNKHVDCHSFSIAQSVITKMEGKLKKRPQGVDNLIKLVERSFNELIEAISTEKQRYLSQFENYGLQGNVSWLFKIIKQENMDEINGTIVKDALNELYYPGIHNPEYFDNFKVADFAEIKERIEKEKVQILYNCTKLEWQLEQQLTTTKLTSKIRQIRKSVDKIDSYFPKKVNSYKLLYRASQNQYSVAEFHKKCDGVAHTLVLIKTGADKCIGGYTPNLWTSQGAAHKADNTGTSFIFSLDEKYPCINNTYATYYNPSYGPCFGQVSDIYITERCHENPGTFNFPSFYNNGKTKNQQTYTQFSGATNGYSILIKQWQVFQVEFQN